MEASKFAQELRHIIKQLKADGVEEIKSDNLIEYLSNAAKDLQSTEVMDVELHKANLQKSLEEHKASHAHSVEMFRTVITAGQNALRTSFLMNGGSSVAIFAFIGHLATDSPDKVHLFSTVLTTSLVGVLLSALASGMTYLTQWVYAHDTETNKKTGLILNIVAIVLAIGSYLVFVYVIFKAYGVFNNFT